MFGTLVFLCSDKDVEHIEHIVESDMQFVVDSTAEVEGPYKFHLEESGILYKVRFTDDQWLNIIEMSAILEANSIEADIVHAVSDDKYVDVVSTSGYYDQFADDGPEMVKLYEQFGFDITEDVVDDEDYED